MNVQSPVPLFADCVASLDVRRLYRLGLFNSSPNALRIECPVVSSERRSFRSTCRGTPTREQVRIALSDRWQARAQTVRVGQSREAARRGLRISNARSAATSAEKLYYADGGWGGRKAKGLKYSTQFGSQHDRFSHTISRLTSLLEGSSDRPPPSPQRRAQLELRLAALKARLSPARRGRGRPRKPRDEPHRFADLEPVAAAGEASASLAWLLACERALERAEALGGDLDDSLGWAVPPQRRPSGRDRPDAARDRGTRSCAWPRLSRIPSAHQPAGAGPEIADPRGARRGVRLDWTGLGCEIDACCLMVDLRDEDAPFAGLEIVSGGQAVDQALRLVRSAHGGMRFVCPLSGLEVDTIAYRAGCFASASALRLTRRRGYAPRTRRNLSAYTRAITAWRVWLLAYIRLTDDRYRNGCDHLNKNEPFCQIIDNTLDSKQS